MKNIIAVKALEQIHDRAIKEDDAEKAQWAMEELLKIQELHQ